MKETRRKPRVFPARVHRIRPGARKFVIVFEGRTGSSCVTARLNHHPEVLCYPEVLAGLNPASQGALLQALADGEDVARFNAYALHPRYYPEPPSDKLDVAVYGLKTKLTDVHDPVALLDLLERNDFALIYLRRMNVVKSVISELNAVRLYEAHSSWNAESPDHVVDRLDADGPTLLGRFRHRCLVENLHQAFYYRFRGTKRVLLYEDLLADEGRFFDSLFGFLGVESVAGSGRFFKATPDRLHDALADSASLDTLMGELGSLAPLASMFLDD